MANILDRIFSGIDAVSRSRKKTGRVDLEAVEKQLDEMILKKEIVPVEDEIVEEKAVRKSKSKLEVRDSSTIYYYAYNFLQTWISKSGKIPCVGDPSRDEFISKFWPDEPILAGAVYSMTAKMTAQSWSITGRRNTSLYYAKLLGRAAHMGGYDWGGFVSSTANNFYTADRGVFWETPRVGSRISGKLGELGHIDSLACTLTGSKRIPMIYTSELTGQIEEFREGEYKHFASLPFPQERYLGTGLCAVSRAYRAAKLLTGLHDYDEEKLANLPPEGVAAVTGLTKDEFEDAIKMWKAKREQDDSLTFPQVLWLIGSQPNVQVSVDFAGFSQIPEQFDRHEVITQYVSTLALDFGVDAREFWPISSGSLGTAAESEIQHLKAKGKGPGEFITLMERSINSELPDGSDFKFDTQDIEEDQTAAAVAKAWVDAWLPLTMAGGATEDIITKEQLLRLLADKNAIPDYLVNDERIVINDNEIHNKEYHSDGHPEDFTKIVWKDGILSESRLPPIVVNSRSLSEDVPFATPIKKKVEKDYSQEWIALKQKEQEILESHRNIKGQPIPDGEAERGGRVTQSAIKAELERWRNHPILSQYAPTVNEEGEISDESDR